MKSGRYVYPPSADGMPYVAVLLQRNKVLFAEGAASKEVAERALTQSLERVAIGYARAEFEHRYAVGLATDRGAKND